MLQQLAQTDNIQREVTSHITKKRKAELGQFMTPSRVARFMASLFPASLVPTCRLLDAGAGVGALTCAFLDRWVAGGFSFESVDVTAYEIDEMLCEYLTRHLTEYNDVHPHIIEGDYIDLATAGDLQQGYTHAILNPPYKKINSGSVHRLTLRQVGIETVNLYSAFVALAVSQSAPSGQIVAIIPRSFCNGPYYRPFRDFILKRATLRHMHLFESRSTVFKDDQVLQETIIIRLEVGGQQGMVTVSTSTDDTFTNLTTHEYPFDQIISPNDPEKFIHVPLSPQPDALDLSPLIRYTLTDLDIQVSTGPVVDFRMKNHLRNMPEPGAVPLLYPVHFSGTDTVWPLTGIKKPNAIQRNEDTEKWLYPNGFYCVVRRFSAKEEKRRVVASVVAPDAFGTNTVLGFENHLNVFHSNKHGLSEMLARGLSVFLNSTAVDENFRRFNGHTQVNATDLKTMKYPSRDALTRLGEWAMTSNDLTQRRLDEQIAQLIA